ncbi:MAG TPA: hypothetical protein DD706_22915 [Nitrospiraceae bacterium]|nr:hypothetical protein [Nitrospiraceae bacterium]
MARGWTQNMKLVYALLLLVFAPTTLLAVSAIDDLPDLTGGVIPLLSYDTGESGGGQLFSGGRLSSRGEVHYLVRIKNQSGDPILAESLIVVVHKIQESARLRDVTLELDLPNADGHTKDGLPYFHVPVDSMPYLQPYAESQPFKLEIKNPNLFRLYPPVLRVYGARLTPAQAYQDTLKTLNKDNERRN